VDVNAEKLETLGYGLETTAVDIQGNTLVAQRGRQ
jgi:hypothetical protein